MGLSPRFFIFFTSYPALALILSQCPDARIGGQRAYVSDLGIDQMDLISSSCGGASHALPACSGLRQRLTLPKYIYS